MSKTILFPLLGFTLFMAIHYLFYTRIIKRLNIREETQNLFKYLTLFNFICILGYMFSRYTMIVPYPIYYILALSLGFGVIMFAGIIFYEFLYVVQSNIPIDQSKRAFFKRSSDIGFLTLGVGYAGAGIVTGAKEPIIVEVEVKQSHFNKPYKIAQISDMHISGLIDREFVRKSVEMINAQEPDFVVITGDLIDTDIENIQDAVDELQNLKSRLGTFFVVGNHEYFHNMQNILLYLKKIHITVLENDAIKIEDFYMVGVYDTFGYRYGSYVPNIQKATRNIPKDKPTLLLAHQPKFVEYLEDFKPSLMLSGHTHGGQVWPLGYLVKLKQPYLRGLYELGDKRHIYVNSGIGFWGPPLRLGTSAEITMIYWG